MSADGLERVIAQVTQGLVVEGAIAVGLTGSYVRGELEPESDLDFIALGEGESRLRLIEARLVSVAWRTEEESRAEFAKPEKAGTVVPGWRKLALLHDPEGAGARLKEEAAAWTWEALPEPPDEWVADELTGWAEEVHKLVAALRTGELWMAAVQRLLLALKMAAILGVHHRLLFETENRLWDMIGEIEGEEWRRLQAAAFGEGGEDIPASSRAAIEMYACVAAAVRPLLDDGQRQVVDNACRIALSRGQAT